MTLSEFINPSDFTFQDMIRADPAIAVFGAPVDTSIGNPSICYQVYQISEDAMFFTDLKEILKSLSARPWGAENEDVIDTLSTAVLITWENIQPPGSAPGDEVVTYQAVVFTNGRRTGVMMLYEQGRFSWNPDSKFVHVRIGYNSKVTTLNRFSSASLRESYRPDLNIGLSSGVQGILVYRLDNNPSTFVNSRLFCLDWFQNDQATLVPSLFWRLIFSDHCPWTIFQAIFDPRYRSCRYVFDSSPLSVFNTRPFIPFCQQSRRLFFGGGYRCTYFFGLLPGYFGDLWWASHYEAYTFNYQLWLANDVLPRYHCCQLAGGDFCNYYELRRPRSTSRFYFPPRLAWFWGDPHINTLDGRRYTFNGLGEYFMLTYDNGDPFVLQARTGKAFNNSEPVDTGTVFTGFAATQGITTVEFSLNDNRTDMRIRINQTEEINDLTVLEGDGYASDDTTFSLTRENGTTPDEIRIMAYFQVGNLSATSFTVTFNNGILDLIVSAPPDYDGEGRGLLGNGNGNSSDDFMFPNRTTLEDSLATNLTDKEIYEFGQSWQITEMESLFYYDGTRNFTYYNPANYTPIFLSDLLAQDPERTAAARAACGDNEMCLFDYLAVNPELGEQTMQTGNTFDEDLNNLENFPPNVTAITDFSDALQDEERILCVQVNETVTLGFTAVDPNDDVIEFMFADPVPDGAALDNNGNFSWTPTSLNVSRIEVVVSDDRGANTSISFSVKICRCDNGGECDFTTQAVGQNLNANGYAVVVCNCTNGWAGDHCDEDFDSCAGNPCYTGVFCSDNPPGSATEFECDDCPSHLQGDGIQCYDFNECNDTTANDCEQNCHNIIGGYYCSCNEGFTLSLDERSCIDNEGCTPTAMNNTGSPNCTCDDGYEFTNGTCLDFDECWNNVDDCPDGISTCINTAGDYFCECVVGYDTDNATKSCEDVDECASQLDNCNATGRVCINTVGNYTCVCPEGSAEINGACQDATTLFLQERFDYIVGLTVEDYPETIESEASRAQLANELFDFLNDTSIFGDDTLIAVLVTNHTVTVEGIYAIVEFRIDTTNSNLTSSDVALAFTNSLPATRTFGSNNRIAEEDVDECTQFDDICRNGNCTNTDGSFFCTCSEGFQGDGTDSCTDIDECRSDHGCQQICNNEEGTYSCACSNGYELDGGGFNCTDIDECSGNSSVCDSLNGMCMNSIGSYNCSCNSGYELDVDGRTCTEAATTMTTISEASTTMMTMMIDSSTSMTTMITDDSTSSMTAMMTDTSISMTTTMIDASTIMMTMTDTSTSMATMVDASTTTTAMTDASTTTTTMTDASTSMTTITDASTSTRPQVDGSTIMMTMTDTSTSMTTMVDASTTATTMADASTSMTTMVDASTIMMTMTDASTTMATMTDPNTTPTTMTDASTIMTTMTDATTSMTTMMTDPVTNPVTTSAPPALVTRRVRISVRANRRNGEPLVYTSDLSDPNSSAFTELEIVFCGAVHEYLNRTHGTILRSYVCVVLLFSPGSVVGDMQIDVGADNADQVTVIGDTAYGIPAMNTELVFGNSSISVVPEAVGGLSTGAIVAIVLGVIVGLLLIILCSCCILVQMASRNNAARKLALGEAYHGPYARDSPVFFSDDPFDESHTNNSLDLREYAVGQAVERIARDRARRNETHANGREHFRTPYIVGDDEVRSVERNPIYF